MYCAKCGTENKDDGKFCSKCGNDLSKTSGINNDKTIVDQPTKKKWTAWQYFFIFLGLIQIWGFIRSVNDGSEIGYTNLGSGILFFAIVVYLRFYRK